MIKVSFKDFDSKVVKRFNDKVTIVTLTGKTQLPSNLVQAMPIGFFDWLDLHSNPEIKYMFGADMTIIAKGKAVRSNKDKDNPLLAERIAESKAKLKIYTFIHALISKYILEYSKLITGYDEPLMSNVKDTDESLYGMADTYMRYITTEEKHLEDLIAQS